MLLICDSHGPFLNSSILMWTARCLILSRLPLIIIFQAYFISKWIYIWDLALLTTHYSSNFFPLFVWPLNWLDEISSIQDSRRAMDPIRALQLHKCICITNLPNIRLAAFVLYFIWSIRFTKRNTLLSSPIKMRKSSRDAFEAVKLTPHHTILSCYRFCQ